MAEKDVVSGCISFKRLNEEKLEVWLEDYSISQTIIEEIVHPIIKEVKMNETI